MLVTQKHAATHAASCQVQIPPLHNAWQAGSHQMKPASWQPSDEACKLALHHSPALSDSSAGSRVSMEKGRAASAARLCLSRTSRSTSGVVTHLSANRTCRSAAASGRDEQGGRQRRQSAGGYGSGGKPGSVASLACMLGAPG